MRKIRRNIHELLVDKETVFKTLNYTHDKVKRDGLFNQIKEIEKELKRLQFKQKLMEKIKDE